MFRLVMQRQPGGQLADLRSLIGVCCSFRFSGRSDMWSGSGSGLVKMCLCLETVQADLFFVSGEQCLGVACFLVLPCDKIMRRWCTTYKYMATEKGLPGCSLKI